MGSLAIEKKKEIGKGEEERVKKDFVKLDYIHRVVDEICSASENVDHCKSKTAV